MGKKFNQAPEAKQEQGELFVLLHMKVTSISVPYVREGKVEWVNHIPANWNREAQETLFAYWRQRATEDDKFNIEAKKEKLFHLE